eukprot:11218451-Lingulodinium_polyedra.AAC.1
MLAPTCWHRHARARVGSGAVSASRWPAGAPPMMSRGAPLFLLGGRRGLAPSKNNGAPRDII